MTKINKGSFERYIYELWSGTEGTVMSSKFMYNECSEVRMDI